MKVVEINSGFRGSTGTIMLSIADLVRSCGGEAYTFSEKSRVLLQTDINFLEQNLKIYFTVALVFLVV